MESKNIKIIDEHNIDRTANKICAIEVDGSDYVVYSIERDNDNDNIFVSKLINNINSTSSMMNIEDGMEKEKMSSIVKELIKHAIDAEEDKLNDEVVSLADGKNVKVISNVIDTKEQNINVQKTYITTVKKSVVKVSEDFYDVKMEEKKEEPVISDIFPVLDTPVEEKKEDVLPDLVPNVVEPVLETSPVLPEVNEEKIESTPVVNEIVNELITPIIPEVSAPVANEISVETPTLKIEPVVPESVPTIEPIIPVSAPVPQPEVKEQTLPEVPSAILPEPAPVVIPSTPEPFKFEPVTNSVPSIMPAPLPTEPVIPASSVVISASPVETPASNGNMLVFDGSKESNLNEALGEVSSDNVVKTLDVQPIREFGVDEVKPEVPSILTPNTPVENTVPTNESVKTLTRTKAGFANNKFFMVVAILFFVAACVFLGYEAFRYFQAVK